MKYLLMMYFVELALLQCNYQSYQEQKLRVFAAPKILKI